MAPSVTMLDLVNAVSEFARSESEVMAAVIWMVNSGSVRLGGNFRGARFDLASFATPPRLAPVAA